MNKKPNIFNYATSELSQDALICYLLDYFNYKQYEEENLLSNKFLKEILNELEVEVEIKKLEIRKQYKKIDVLLILNNKHYIIIEDKTNTKHHTDQIRRYITALEEENIKRENIYGLYYKTGDESHTSLQEMIKNKKEGTKEEKKFNKYGVLMREGILKLLSEYKGNNLIINDYRNYLMEIEDSQKQYKKYNNEQKLFYDWDGIKGFYKKLDEEILKLKKDGKWELGNDEKEVGFNWDYVPNKTGGFMCYWFDNILNFEKKSFYLQIEKINVKSEEEKRNTKWAEDIIKYPSMTLVVKVWSENKNIKILYQGLDIFKKKYPDKFSSKIFLKPNRFSNGKYMTQLLINDFLVFKEEEINIEKTALKILEYIRLLKSLEKELSKIEG